RNSRWRLQRCRLCRSKELSRAFDWLDVMHPAAIPMRAEIDATRCGEMVEKVGHRMVRTMRGDEGIARKRSAPVAFAACHEDGFTRLVGERIESAPHRGVADAPLSPTRTRIGQDIGPPFFACGLVRVRP